VYFQEAFKLNPTDPEVRERFLSSVNGLESWELGRDTLKVTLGLISDPELLVQDHLRVARWEEERFANQEGAIQSYRDALEVEPQSKPALESLERLYRASDQGDALAEILRHQAEATYEDEERTQKLSELAEVLWGSLGRADEATRVYEDLLMMNDQDASYYQALRQIYQSEERSGSIVELIEREVDARGLTGAEASTSLAEAAELMRQEGDLTRAVDLYRRAREHDERSEELRGALISLYRALESWDDLRDLLDERLEGLQGADAQALLFELAQLCELKLLMPDDAYEYYERLLKGAPGHREAFKAARSILSEQLRNEELAQLSARHLEHAQGLEATERVELHLEVASIAIEERDHELAVEHLNAVLESNSAHPRALMTLAKLHEEEGEWAEATARLSAALEVASAGPERGEAYKRLGMIYLNELEQLTDAKEALNQASEELADAQVLEALARIAREESDDQALYQRLGQLEVTQSGKAKARTCIELATVAQRLGDSDAQLRALETAYQETPESPKVIEPLVALYIGQGRLEEANPLLQSLIKELETKRKKKPLSRALYQLGQLCEAQARPDEALEAYERARKEDATFASNLVALSTLLVTQGRGQEAQDTLKALLLQRQLSSAERVQVFYLNGLVRVETGDERKAKDMFTRALDIDPEHEGSKAQLASLT
jgi:tetratricopeptide (TPR) repeat protein